LAPTPHLGGTGDFWGVATLCGTGTVSISISLYTGTDPGGVYAVSYEYQPPGGSLTTITRLYYVNAEGKEGPPGCNGNASDIISVGQQDLYLCGSYPADAANCDSKYLFNTKVANVNDTVTAINNKAKDLKRPIMLLMDSHGSPDTWNYNNGGPYLSENDAPNGPNATNVTNLGNGSVGNVTQLTFVSCCTGKKYANGQNPNVLAVLSGLLTAPGQHPSASVCGFSMWVWDVQRGGKTEIAISQGDQISCAGGN
jgi:hypothetical protein